MADFFPAKGASTPMDGLVGYGSADAALWADRRTASTCNITDVIDNDDLTPRVRGDALTDKWDIWNRAVFGFDTSSIPDTDVISAATFSVWVNTVLDELGSQSLVLDRCVPASTDNLEVGDFYLTDHWDEVDQATTQKSLGSISTGQYLVFTLNATGIANINKAGISWLGLRLSCDFSNTEPSWGNGDESYVNIDFADDPTPDNQRPKLSVTHSAGAATSIKSVNGLAIASVKSRNGLAIASIKSINSLSNVS